MQRQTNTSMIDVDEARSIVVQQSSPLPTVELPLREALHRTLAKPIACDVDYPPFDRALMDGFAVIAADTAAAPVTLRVVGQIAAGSDPARAINRGEAMQINTGAPVPPGADAVVRVEDTELSSDRSSVVVKLAARKRQSITDRATYVSAGSTVLKAGSKITALEVAVAATAGAARVTVYRQPKVAILVTGDELIDVDERPSGAKIRNSNEPMLEALVRAAHAESIMLGVARDDRNDLRTRIEQGLSADVLCITGGVSMGEFDFVPEVLAELGVEVGFQKMIIKPGRPVLFAKSKRGTLIFALPGNPVSAFVGFHLLVRPALAAMHGRTTMDANQTAARLIGSMKATENRRSYWPGTARTDADGAWEVTPLLWHGSGDVFGMAGANCLIMRPPGAPAVGEGGSVMIQFLESASG